jgi:hypothetical protein
MAGAAAGATAGMAGGAAGMAGATAGMAGATAGMAGAAAGATAGMAGGTAGTAGATAGMGGATAGVTGMAGSAGSADVLLAYAPLDGAAGALDKLADGTGWGDAWSVQNEDVTQPGYSVQATTPLAFGALKRTPSYASGGRLYLGSGRLLAVAAGGPFDVAGYRDATSGLIGVAGKTLWVSALLRADVLEGFTFSLHSSRFVHWDGDPSAPAAVSIGYLGDGCSDAGTRYWCVRVGPNTAAVTRTSVAMTAGQTVLVVVAIDFGNPGRVRFWLNPGSLGGAAPAPTIDVPNVTASLALQAVTFYPGKDAGDGSIDELRFGTSWAAVTPTQ